MIGNPKLIIFDADGTLRDYETGELLPGVETFFTEDTNTERRYAIATNQGGVGLRYWMELDGFGKPDEYPTEESILKELGEFSAELADLAEYGDGIPVYVAFAYQSKKSGKWSPDPRPAGGEHRLPLGTRRPQAGGYDARKGHARRGSRGL